MYAFEKPGYKNTDRILGLLKGACQEYGIKEVVLASTHGTTGLAAARMLQDAPDIRLIVVTHNFGLKDAGTLEMSPETRSEIESLGATVYTGTMPFRNIGTAIRQMVGYSQQDLVANTLRMLGQGLKVCVEIALMASDAGLIGTNDILTVAGTARGADTLALIKPAPSNRLFDLKIRNILAKPVNW